jgi:hypothetical protein
MSNLAGSEITDNGKFGACLPPYKFPVFQQTCGDNLEIIR